MPWVSCSFRGRHGRSSPVAALPRELARGRRGAPRGRPNAHDEGPARLVGAVRPGVVRCVRQSWTVAPPGRQRAGDGLGRCRAGRRARSPCESAVIRRCGATLVAVAAGRANSMQPFVSRARPAAGSRCDRAQCARMRASQYASSWCHGGSAPVAGRLADGVRPCRARRPVTEQLARRRCRRRSIRLGPSTSSGAYRSGLTIWGEQRGVAAGRGRARCGRRRANPSAPHEQSSS